MAANKFKRLADGVGGRIKGTIEFIRKQDMPESQIKDVTTYGSFVCTVRLEKDKKKKIRFVVGRDQINSREM